MDGYLDYKATVWFRIPIGSKELMEKVLKALAENETPMGLYDNDVRDELGACEILYDTEEFINPNENDGHSTIEVYVNGDKDIEMIWDNSYESEIKRKENDKSK